MASGDNKTIENAAKLLGMCAAASLGISLIYDWGYFSTLGFSFNELPTTLADHARTALDWGPTIATLVFFGVAYILLTQRIEGGKTEQEIIEESDNPEKARRMRTAAEKWVRYAAMGSIATLILLGERGANSLMLVGLLWIGFADWAQEHPRIASRRSWHTRTVIAVGPALALFIWFSGRYDAIQVYRAPPSAKVFLAGEKGVIEATIIRFFDKGVLIKEKDSVVVFRQWSTVDHVQMLAAYQPFQGIVCSWFHIGCSDSKPQQKKAPQENQK